MAVLCGLTVLLATATAQAEDWQVAKEKDGIKVSLSEVAAPGFMNARARNCSSTKAIRAGPTLSSTRHGR
jgi:hypothetical protein